jgi:hypothetical protein
MPLPNASITEVRDFFDDLNIAVCALTNVSGCS